MKKFISTTLTAALMASSFLTAAQPAAAQPDWRNNQDRKPTQAQADARAQSDAQAQAQAQTQAQAQAQRDGRDRGGPDRGRGGPPPQAPTGRGGGKPQPAPQPPQQAQAPVQQSGKPQPYKPAPQQQVQTPQKPLPFGLDNRDNRGGRDGRGDGRDHRGGDQRGPNRGPGGNNGGRSDGDRGSQWHPQPSRGDRDRNRPRYDPRRYPREIHPRQRYYWRGPAYRYPPGFYANQWFYGDILPWGWYSSDYYIDNWYWYGLEPPPAGFEWVRSGRDAILVDVFTGRVYEVVYDLFW